MTIIEYIKTEKSKKGLSNQELSNLSGIPIGTINRILSGGTENPSFQTISDIITGMGGSMDEALGISKKEVQKNNDELYEKLLAHKDRWILRLFYLALILAAALIFILVFDLLSPNIGFVHY